MLKYSIAAASALVAHAVPTYFHPTTAMMGATTNPAVLQEIILDTYDQIKIDAEADGSITYYGVWDEDVVPTSHTELATGGPYTKVVCAGSATGCILDLYKGDDKLNPLPAGIYSLYAMNGNEATYSSAIFDAATELKIEIAPYILAWGTTTSQSDSVTVERGTNIYITWDGLSMGDVIEYRQTTITTAGTVVTPCAISAYTITSDDATAGRGTISLATAEVSTSFASSVDAIPFAITGDHTINVVRAGDVATVDYTSATCDLSSLSPAAAALPVDTNYAAVSRSVEVTESDTVSSTPTTVEAGAKITITYNFASAVTSGTYAGLFTDGERPAGHSIGGNTGEPLAKSYLPVGVSGAGVIQLQVPIDTPAGNAAGTDYIVYLFNDNDSLFTPLADTSYLNQGDSGLHDTGVAVAKNTDTTVISAPTGQPSGQPSGVPSGQPSSMPTSPTGEPTGIPTSSPSFVEEPWGEYVWTEKRHRKAGMCENQCSGHGTCEVNGNCKCFKGLDGEDEWTGPDCSQRTCPFDFAWVGAAINSNNLHPWAECSNKGTCDRGSGECQCFTGYEGAACQRTVCPDNCNDQGTCWPEKHLANKAGRVYDAPWDAMKHVGCLCDAGYRGPACDQQECPSGADPLSGYGNEAGRDCSGRGICDYSSGICACFTGFFGTRCQHQTTVI